MTVVSAPLYVYFGWLSDRIGRKPVMVGGMLLALVLYFPASHWIADAANPALVEAQRSTPVFVETDPATCSVQFDPSAPPSSSAPATSPRARSSPRASRFTTRPSPDGATPVVVGTETRCRSPAARASAAPDLKALKAKTADAIGAELQAAGYPKAPIRAHANMTLLIIILLAVRRCRDRALRPAGRGAGRDVPDARALHGHVVPLPRRHGLGRRLPAGHQLRARRDHRQYLRRPVVRRSCSPRISVVVSLLFLKETAGRRLEEV